jgi:transitional endoplasmic reticulum ATPase
MPLAKDVDFDHLVKNTGGYSGADIEALCREAAMTAMREALYGKGNLDKKKVTQNHFKEALKKIRPSITDKVQEAYDSFLTRYETRELEKLAYVG